MPLGLGLGPQFPSIAEWANGAITGLFTAVGQAATANALNNILSKDAIIMVNGIKISRPEFLNQLQGDKPAEKSATVKVVGLVGVPVHQTAPQTAGTAGLFLTVTDSESFLVFGGEAEYIDTVSINLVIEEDPSHAGSQDPRRITMLNAVIKGAPVPATLAK